MDYSFYVVALVVLFVLSAFFSSSETALLSFNRIKLKHLVSKGDKKAIRVEKLLNKVDEVLTTILVGNNIVNILASSLTTALAIKLFGDKGVFISTLFVSIVILIMCEVTPKSIATNNSERVTYFILKPLEFLFVLLRPIVIAFTFITKLILKLLKINNEDGHLFTEEEFHTLIDEGEKVGVLEKEETEMIRGVVDFHDKKIREIIKTHRTEIVAIENTASYQEVKDIIIENNFSRYPVYDDSIDNIIGILYSKDLLTLDDDEISNFDVTKIMRKDEEVIFAPETKTVREVFTEMKTKRTHIAVILDEYFGVLGILTLEDALEIIVGDIEDESDRFDKYILSQKDDVIVINPHMQIYLFNQAFMTNIPSDGLDTMNGFIMSVINDVPKRNMMFSWANLEFEIIQVKGRKPIIVKIVKIDD